MKTQQREPELEGQMSIYELLDQADDVTTFKTRAPLFNLILEELYAHGWDDGMLVSVMYQAIELVHCGNSFERCP